MLTMIPKCLHCQTDLPGWHYPIPVAYYPSNHTWQKCPVCEGTGRVFDAISSGGSRECPACKGNCMVITP
jgi:hypothetical protein